MIPARPVRLLLVLATLAALPACSDGTGPELGPPARLDPFAGEAQEAQVATLLPKAVAVRVTAEDGRPVPQVIVTWTVIAGGGSVSPGQSTTDAEGLAQTAWMLGTTAGLQEIRVSVQGGLVAVITATASPGPVAAMNYVSGDGQEAEVEGPLADSLVVRVTDIHGNPVLGADVNWVVTEGAGSVSPASMQTNAVGRARTQWTLGPVAGQNNVTAGIPGVPVYTFGATGKAGSPADLLILAGDGQAGPASGRLADSLVVRVTDARGNPVPGAEVSWTVLTGGGSVSPATVLADAEGRAAGSWTLGAILGEQSVRASIGALSVDFSATADSSSGPILTGITPDLLLPGEPATITGHGFAWQPADNEVSVGGVSAAVTAATETELSIIVPDRSAYACEPTRSVPVVVTAGGLSGGLAHPLAVATQIQLAAGESVALLEQDQVLCNELPQTGGSYVVTVFNTGTAPAALTSFEFHGLSLGPAPSPDPFAPAGELAARQQPLLTWTVPGELSLFENPTKRGRILEAGRELAMRLMPYHRPDRLGAGISSQLVRLQSNVPAAGDTLSFRIPDINSTGSFCANYIEVQARTVYVGQRALIFEDLNSPLAGAMDGHYQFIGQEYDSLQHDIVLENFGNPLRLNTSGADRVMMLFSPVVNNLGGVAAFVWPGDFFARNECASSDEAELFYGIVATQSGSGYSGQTADNWLRSMRSTVIHEVKHVASFAERIWRVGGWEDVWLEEATARASEELFGRAIFGYQQGGRTNYAASVYCEVRPTWSECAGRPLVMFKHFNAIYRHYQNVETLTPLANMEIDPAAYFYGSGWLLTRWAADHYGGGDAAFYSALVQSNTSGVTNLEAVTNRTFPQILADFSLAMALDERPDFQPARGELEITSWDTRDIFRGLNTDFPGSFPVAFPLAARQVQFGSFAVSVPSLRAGTTAIFELSGTQSGTQLLTLHADGGGEPSPVLRMAIARVQ